MLQNEKLEIKPKVAINPSAPAGEIIQNLDKYIFRLEGECDGRFAKRLARLIESEKAKINPQ